MIALPVGNIRTRVISSTRSVIAVKDIKSVLKVGVYFSFLLCPSFKARVGLALFVCCRKIIILKPHDHYSIGNRMEVILRYISPLTRDVNIQVQCKHMKLPLYSISKREMVLMN